MSDKKTRILKDISIDETNRCKDIVHSENFADRLCINPNCECVWSQYEQDYFYPHYSELEKNEKDIRESFLKSRKGF